MFNYEFHWVIKEFLTKAGWVILVRGAYLVYLKDKEIKFSHLLIWVFLINMLMSLPSLLLIENRFGVDTTAYLNQAGQVYNGQRDYKLIDTN